ncbi:hypothetical protein ACQ4PT_020770 [Festuca glaucescens]
MVVLEIYRNTSIGRALTDTLGEMVSSGKLDPARPPGPPASMCAALENKVTSRFLFKGNLRTYRYCDSVWTFNLRDVTFRNGDISEDIGKVKIVACDSNLLKPKVPLQQ